MRRRSVPSTRSAILLLCGILAIAGPALGQGKPALPRLKPIDLAGDPQSGESIYLDRCWACHGLSGEGKGPASFGMTPAPSDFTAGALGGKSDPELLDAILKGKPGTAMYAQPLDPQSAVDVLAYLKTLPRSPAQERTLIDALARGDKEAGRVIYNSRCWPCHGPTGSGNGPAAAALRPPPADFTDPDKVISRTGARLYSVLTHGIPGTGMSAQSLTEKEKFDVIAYLRSLVRYGGDQPGIPATVPSGNPRAGKEIYDKRCWACHGTLGDGNGPAAPAMIPSPTRFSDYEKTKERPPTDWFNAIRFGVPGTAMYPQRLTESEAWDLVAYLKTLGRRETSTP